MSHAFSLLANNLCYNEFVRHKKTDTDSNETFYCHPQLSYTFHHRGKVNGISLNAVYQILLIIYRKITGDKNVRQYI